MMPLCWRRLFYWFWLKWYEYAKYIVSSDKCILFKFPIYLEKNKLFFLTIISGKESRHKKTNSFIYVKNMRLSIAMTKLLHYLFPYLWSTDCGCILENMLYSQSHESIFFSTFGSGRLEYDSHALNEFHKKWFFDFRQILKGIEHYWNRFNINCIHFEHIKREWQKKRGILSMHSK